MAETEFSEIHKQAVELNAHLRPVDVTYPLGRLVSTGGAEISATIEPPTIILTQHSFKAEGESWVFHDITTTELSVDDSGKLNGVDKWAEQERSRGGEPDGLWAKDTAKLTDLAASVALKQVAKGLAHALRMEQALGKRS